MSDEKTQGVASVSYPASPSGAGARSTVYFRLNLYLDFRDLVQVKYELLRRVQVEGNSVSHATALFALSRPTFYAAQAAWERTGLVGLLPEPTGPRHGHKLTEEILELLTLRAFLDVLD